ncbi:MAG: flavin reductase family protein [Saprospiraceae bacterium]|nr:flavin reductase family protein [Saprospiraceae bacterium]
MRKIVPGTIPTADFHQYLLGAVSPRPIAFASTLDKNGVPNLAPYSFFNCFSSNPPILVFSSNRKVGNNTTKDTLHNVMETGEVVINVVTYNIVRQAAITSIEYPPEVSEFEKAGFTPIASELVKPFRVKESPIHIECKVNQIIPLGEQGGAGHLIICEVLQMHIDEAVLDEKERIDPHKIDLMGRMGRAFYVRASGEAVHTIFQPYNILGIGFDQLPKGIRHSKILTGNDLGQLAALTEAPARSSVLELKNDPYIQQLLQSENPLEELHRYAQKELAKENVALAARIAWLGEQL